MFKTRKKVIRKCKSNRQFTDRSNGTTRKIEGNSNLTNKRLTIPPGFLCLGIASDTIQKEKNPQNSYTQQEYILQEDLHSLFNNNINKDASVPIRRSSRISKQIEKTRNEEDVRVSDYYCDILKHPGKREDPQKPHYNKHGLVRNNSKSLFREINKQCARIDRQSAIPLNCSEGSSSNTPEGFQPSTFCNNLYKEVRVDINADKTLLKLKSTIANEIDNINLMLSGKLSPSTKMDEDHEKRNINMDVDREETLTSFEYVPKCEWVFKTPPRQRIIVPKISECAIQPAVICTTKKQSNIYELNPNVEIDLNKYTKGQNVEVDHQYMRHLASFQDNMQIDVGVDRLLGNGISNRRVVNVENHNYNQNQEYSKFYMNNPFLNPPESNYVPIMSRPTKSASKISRTGNMFKRKIEELEATPTAANMHGGSDSHFEGDFTFINDDGEFKMTNTQSLVDEPNFNFHFKKNLFKACGEESLFNFSKEEPKVFDFSQLRRDDC